MADNTAIPADLGIHTPASSLTPSSLTTPLSDDEPSDWGPGSAETLNESVERLRL